MTEQQTKQKYSYKEPKEALNSRINAHAQYSNFNLHEWIKEEFQIKSGDKILDLGCGNGNYTKVFWDFVQPEGRIIGLDKNEMLIEQAKSTHNDLPQTHVEFCVHNFDDPFPHLDVHFDWIFTIYSIYYTEDSLKIIDVLKRQLNSGGQLIVIGPAPNNVMDLIEFNIELTGVKPNREFSGRIERIEMEFKPLFEKIFAMDHVRYQTIDSVMQFPTAESYAEYYFSTLLWRESTEGRTEKEIEHLRNTAVDTLSRSLPAKIHKQMSCLIGEVNQR